MEQSSESIHTRTQPPAVWSTAEIAEYLRVQRKAISNRLIHMPDFPEPLRGTSRPMLWLRSEVLDYLIERR